MDERAAVRVDHVIDLAWADACRGGGVVPPLVNRRRRHAAQASEHANGPLPDVDLAEQRNLLAELALPLLRPGREERRPVMHDPAPGQDLARLLDHAAESLPVHAHERVPEVEGDRGDGDPRGGHPQVATLDGQMSRKGQYMQLRALGRGV